MKAVASTEDRRKFERIVGRTAQSQQTPFLLSVGQQRWHAFQRVLEESESTVTGSTTSREVGVMRASVYSNDSTDSTDSTDRNETGTSGSPSACVRGLFTGNDVPGTPCNPMRSDSWTRWGQTRENRSASTLPSIDDTSAFMNAAREITENTHQLRILPENVDSRGRQSQRYDIATLKHWQPANGGNTLAIAKEGALRTRFLLSPETEALHERSAANTEYVKHAVKDILCQVHDADYGEADYDGEAREPADSYSTIRPQMLQIEAVEVKESLGLFKENKSQTTIGPDISVDLLRVTKHEAPTIDDKDMVCICIPHCATLPGTGNARTSTLSDTPFQSQDVRPKGGNSTGGESTLVSETRTSSGDGNTLFNDKVKKDQATQRIVAVDHTTRKDSYKADSAPEVTPNERDSAEDEQTHSRADSGTGAKTKETDSTITADAVESKPAGHQVPAEDGVPEKDMDLAEKVIKEHSPVDHFRWLLPASFQ